MSVEIAWKQNILVTDFHQLKSLLVVLGFGSQAFVCGFSRQNINSVHSKKNWLLELHKWFIQDFKSFLATFSWYSLSDKVEKSCDNGSNDISAHLLCPGLPPSWISTLLPQPLDFDDSRLPQNSPSNCTHSLLMLPMHEHFEPRFCDKDISKFGLWQEDISAVLFLFTP